MLIQKLQLTFCTDSLNEDQNFLNLTFPVLPRTYWAARGKVEAIITRWKLGAGPTRQPKWHQVVTGTGTDTGTVTQRRHILLNIHVLDGREGSIMRRRCT